MKNTLFKQMISSLKNKPGQGDERQILENYKVLSLGMELLLAFLVMFSIISETLRIQFGTVFPFTLVQQLIFLVGVICFCCVVLLCKRGALSAVTPGWLIFMGFAGPSFLLAWVPKAIIKSCEKEMAVLTLLLIPIISAGLYFVLNGVYRRYLDAEDE